MDLESGYPFWTVNDGLIETYPRLDRDIKCDVAVLGGGITGALVAHHLVEAGFSTVVLDKRDVGWGSTAASTALLQYEIDLSLTDLSEMLGEDHAARAYLACRDAIGKLERLAGRLRDDVGFERKNSLYLATKKKDRKVLETECELRRSIGIKVDYLTEGDVARRFDIRRPAALLSYDAAQVDAYAFTHALLRDSVRHGLRVFDRTLVAKIDATEDGVALITPDKCIVRARKLVFASGYETRDFLTKQVAHLVSTFALASEPAAHVGRWATDCIVWEHAEPYLYFRTTADGRVIVGGEDEDFRDPAHRDRLLPRKTEKLVARFRDLLPDVTLDVAFAWAGTFGETRDALAYIGEHEDWPSSYFALGYGGNGITYSLIAAEIIRDAMVGKRNRDAELFRFGR